MKYEKLTPERFNDKLKAGEYNGLGGARRAIGKTQGWTKAQQETAKAAAEKYFGTGGSAKKTSKKAGKKTSKKAAVKTAAKTGGRRKKIQRKLHPNVAARAEKAQAEQAEKPAKQQAKKIVSRAGAKLQIPNTTLIEQVRTEVEVATNALAGMRAAKDLANELVDVRIGAQLCADLLKNAVERLHGEIQRNNRSSGMPEEQKYVVNSAETSAPEPVAVQPQVIPPPPGNFVTPPMVQPISPALGE